LDLYNGFGARQASDELRVVALQRRHLAGERVGFGGLRSAFDRRQCAEGAEVALPAPVGQGRGIDRLAAEDGTNAAALTRAVGLGEDAQLVLG